MAEIKCGESRIAYGKSEEQVRNAIAEVTCTNEPECDEDGTKRRCRRRSMVRPSKEDEKFWLGLVICLCPKELEKRGRLAPTRVAPVRKAPRRKPTRRR
jgi:hypothetical protein